MNAEEKNGRVATAKGLMNASIGFVAAEVFGGLVTAVPLMLGAGALLREVGASGQAAEAELRAAECTAILAIPWPFIYAGSGVWVSAVARLRDSLPSFIDLEPVDGLRRGELAARGSELAATSAGQKWAALTDAQRDVLTGAGLRPEMLGAPG